jgi:uncharacterized protein (UPF0210 family)
MMRSNAILDTVSMIQRENLDVRAVTLGIDLLDCRGADIVETCRKIRSKIRHYAADLVATCEAISKKYQDGFAAAKFGRLHQPAV